MLKKSLFALALTFLMTPASAVSADLGAEAESIIKRSKLKLDDFGIFVGTDAKTPMIERNSSKQLIPASVTKLLTAGAVLEHFPPGTKFKTQLVSEAKIDKGSLRGALYLKGAGDPSFVSETMWVLVNNFLRTGVKTVEGDIVVDDSLFDQQRFDDSRQSQRVDRAYDAPTGAMSFNWNSVNIYVRPGKPGEKAEVYLDPENDYLRLTNKVKTVSGGTNEVIADRKENGSGDLITVSGKIGAGSNEMVIYKNVMRPDLWSGSNLKSFLRQRGIEVKGRVRAATAPSSAKVLAEVESKPIEQILADMNKFSNNYVAEMLTKQLGTIKGAPGTIEKGMDVIHDFLKSLGIPKNDFIVINPSGFTRDNRFSALTMWKVLASMQEHFQMAPEFISSLPIAGVDGTMKRRMKASNGERAVRAKTGLLNGVVSLAGYAGRKDGKVIPFVFLYNGNADDSHVRRTVDQILIKIIESP